MGELPNPLPKIPSLEEEIYRRYGTLHFSSVHRNIRKEYASFRRYYAGNYEEWLPQAKDARVVDLACGFGHFLDFLRSAGYTNYLGVDASEECIQQCLSENLEAEKCDIFAWLESNRADVIVANDVLEHLSREALDRFMFQAARALNSGGRLLVKVPNSANPITGPAARYIDYTHHTSFTELSLRAMLMVHFQRAEVRGQNLFVFYENPLNYLGMAGQAIFDSIFRALSILYGQRELKIFKKSLIAMASGPAPVSLPSTETLGHSSADSRS
jgi:2-polyprenyl-3-methyl-5-hydroxy-6-metoxy-1,4-benzoquinol methylase